MSLLLLFGGSGGAPVNGAVAFAGTGSLTVRPSVQGAVGFAGAGSFTTRAALTFYTVTEFEGTGSTLFVSRFTGTDYHLYVVDKNGNHYCELVDADIGTITFELNGAGGLDFTLPTTAAASCVQPGREVQLWRGDQLLFWGPIVRHQIGLTQASYQCSGLLWYFERRFMGRADRVNLITNGDFENSETGWSFSGGVAHSIDLTRKVEGSKSLLLSGATADHVQHAAQTYTHTTQWHPDGDFVTVSAWVYVPSAGYLGGAILDAGLAAIHRRGTTQIGEAQIATIDDDTEKDKWIPMEVGIPAVKAGDTVEVRLYPPHGSANYDLVTVTLMESLSFWPGDDVADIVAGIVDYAQDRNIFTHGKSDLNIDHAGAPTGVIKDVAYQFAEHRNIADAIQEYVRAGYIDIDIAFTPTTRTFTTYAPDKGHMRSDLLLELDTTVADFTYSFDGEQAASSVVVLGPGDGPDRPEGGAVNTDFLGGLDLEWVESAPDDATVGTLDAVAYERLAVGVNPEIIEVTTLPGIGYIGQLQTGDRAPVSLNWGPLAVNATYRAVTITVNPKTDQATVTLNVDV